LAPGPTGPRPRYGGAAAGASARCDSPASRGWAPPPGAHDAGAGGGPGDQPDSR